MWRKLLWQRARYRILLVCTANVCRSPLAEALLRARLRVRGHGSDIAVASAGTAVAAPGRTPDPRMVGLARQLGVKMTGQRARALDARLLAQADLVLAMEREHIAALESLLDAAPEATRRPEVRLLSSYLPRPTEGIADPYFGSADACREAFEQIDQALAALVPALPLPDTRN